MRNWKENDTKMRLLASTTMQTFNHTEGKEKMRGNSKLQ